MQTVSAPLQSGPMEDLQTCSAPQQLVFPLSLVREKVTPRALLESEVKKSLFLFVSLNDCEDQTSPFLEFEPCPVSYSILLSLLGGWVWPGHMNPMHV